MADALDLGVLCWGPLAAGALAGSDRPVRRSLAKVPEPIAKVREGLAEIAARTGLASHTLALAWLMRRSPACVPVIGARLASQFAELLSATAAAIPAEVISEVDGLLTVRAGFPHDLINSPYLRRFATGEPGSLVNPDRSRS